ncbi:MAG: rod shape-determining protein MreC [Holophagales bacterium]|jgi:rod shape-determining protein MreC|nr:rod shape-determining protein MreC [Holophagales bacterium]
MKRDNRLWNPVWWERYTIFVLLFGHLIWVFLGKQADSIWLSTSDLFTRPVVSISAKWENWRYDRLNKMKSLENAQKELDDNRTELAKLRLERQRDSARLMEADEAVNLLGLKKLLPIEMQASRIIANNREAKFGGIVIDLGEAHGIKADQGVICAEGVVGRIWAVGKSQSIVLPLDAYNASTSVMLARSRATGVLQGDNPGLAEIRYISNQETVQNGEPVYTSSLDNVFPKALLVGYVSEVSPGPIEMEIVVTLAAPLDRLGLLFVLPSNPQLEFNTKFEIPPSISKRDGK